MEKLTKIPKEELLRRMANYAVCIESVGIRLQQDMELYKDGKIDMEITEAFALIYQKWDRVHDKILDITAKYDISLQEKAQLYKIKLASYCIL